jgi:hypothetical protein
VLDRAEERQRDGGVQVVSLLFFQVSRPGSGQVRLGIDSKGFYEYGDELGHTGKPSSTVD